jgi:hypothetical protein
MRLAQGFVDPASGIAFGSDNPYVPAPEPAPPPLVVLPDVPSSQPTTTPTVAPIADTTSGSSSSAAPIDTITVTASRPSFWEKYGAWIVLGGLAAAALYSQQHRSP